MSNKNIWFISDLHLGHEKIVEWRKFKSHQEMYLTIRRQIFNPPKIATDDIVYHVGDFAMGPNKSQWWSFLPGKVKYIKGNHDPQSLTNTHMEVIVWQGNQIEIVHRPEDASFSHKIVIHGHIHKTGKRVLPFENVEKINDYIHKVDEVYFYNVNCEFHKYKPKLINEIVGEINHIKKKWK